MSPSIYILIHTSDRSNLAKEGELDAVGVVHSYEDGMPTGSHNTRLTALNVPPMGLFFPMVLVPDAYPPPPSVWLVVFSELNIFAT
ncbi:unnamed protein product [Malus baccata var. baccata]